MTSSGTLCVRKSARSSSRTTVYTASKYFHVVAFLSLGVVGGTAGRGQTMAVGDAATGAVVGGLIVEWHSVLNK
jgi:hypothetical protein